MADMRSKRLQREMQQCSAGLPHGLMAGPINENDLSKWKAIIQGPQGTPFEGGEFHLEITFPDEYPLVPPMVVFKTRIYHMNISSSGYICLDILKEKAWSAAMTLSSVLLSVQSMLNDPNPDDALIPSIAKEWKENKELYMKKAKAWTTKFAKN